MKRCLKRISTCILTAIAVCALLAFSGCRAKKADGEVLFAQDVTLVVRITETEEGATLKDAMEKMRADGKLSFSEDGSGMITSINGYSKTDAYWMLYTSCADYANPSWGSMTYEGSRYDSAVLGYASLPAVEGEIYIWNLSVWNG